MKRRSSIKKMLCAAAVTVVGDSISYAKTYLTLEQAKRSLWAGKGMSKVEVTISKAQAKSIKKASKVRVRNLKPQVWKVSGGGWFILDQVIGKHENIDVAWALTSSGKLRGFEVLVYRETYGHQIVNPKWKKQLYGRGAGKPLKLDRDIKNISGATLSCLHIVGGVNRITQIWEQVLRQL